MPHIYIGGPLGSLKNSCDQKATQYPSLPSVKKYLEGKFVNFAPSPKHITVANHHVFCSLILYCR